MNDYQTMERAIEDISRIKTDDYQESKHLQMMYSFMTAVYNNLQEIAPELN